MQSLRPQTGGQLHDGQEGISVGGGTGTLVEYNTISNNNYLNMADGFESGSYTFDNSTASRIDNQWQLDGGAGNQAYNWVGWQAEGQDVHGSVSS
jgi:hypothetical protein